MSASVGLKSRLASGATCLGGWVTLGCDAIAEVMCDAGFDWIGIDLEHSTQTLAVAESLIRVVDAKGKAPLVRLSRNDPSEIAKVMDAGAHGVIVPRAKGRADAEAAWQAMHYPPEGKRGVGLARAQGYGARFAEHREWLTSSSILIVQIEVAEVLDELDDLFAFPGVDGYMLGPYDLSASLGVAGQLDHPDVVDAAGRALAAAKKHGRAAGIHVVEPDLAALRARLGEGYRFVAYGVDFRMIDAACREGVRVAGG
ncbi:MAG: HpcH/HpaI aldolase/citrate lyase family protein [Sandaracinaceae bacterium]